MRTRTHKHTHPYISSVSLGNPVNEVKSCSGHFSYENSGAQRGAVASRRRQVSFLLGWGSQEEDPRIPISSSPQESALLRNRAEARGLRSKGRPEGSWPRGLWVVTFPAPRRWDQGGSEQHPSLAPADLGWRMKAEGTEAKEVGSQ